MQVLMYSERFFSQATLRRHGCARWLVAAVCLGHRRGSAPGCQNSFSLTPKSYSLRALTSHINQMLLSLQFHQSCAKLLSRAQSRANASCKKPWSCRSLHTWPTRIPSKTARGRAFIAFGLGNTRWLLWPSCCDSVYWPAQKGGSGAHCKLLLIDKAESTLTMRTNCNSSPLSVARVLMSTLR